VYTLPFFSWLIDFDYRNGKIVIPVNAIVKADIRCSCLELHKTIMFQKKNVIQH
jgi:hypothetical protein